MNHLEALRKYTTVVADTGDIDAIGRFRPRDATTNPSLLLQAAQLERYAHLVEGALRASAPASGSSARAEVFLDQLSVNFGREILELVPGRVSTEVSAQLSFDMEGTVAKARRLVGLYEEAGVERERVLIKIASTWEGIRAAQRLEQEGIHCNLTLLFSFAQAVACAEAKVTLISPFVGRIYDWYRKERGVDIPASEDPGVASVRRIYDYYKKFGYETQVMGASFRRTEQILLLSGCDLLTISPELLAQLESAPGDIARALSPERARESDAQRITLDEKSFRWLHNEDAMATDKLAEGIRKFHLDARKLQQWALARVAERVGA